MKEQTLVSPPLIVKLDVVREQGQITFSANVLNKNGLSLEILCKTMPINPLNTHFITKES